MPTKRCKRFTLLELLLALTVLLVLTGLTAQLIYSLPLGWRMHRERAARLEGLIALERVADHAWRNLVPFDWRDEVGRTDRPVFRGDPELVIGACRVGADPKGNSLLFFSLGKRGDRLIAQYRREPIVWFARETMPETLHEEVLLENVVSAAFRYAEVKDGELVWHDDWDEDKRRDLPVAIGLVVDFTDGAGARFLRRTAGNSYYTRLGGAGNGPGK